MLDFISNAYAEAATAPAEAAGPVGADMMTFIYLGLFAVLIYFVLLRPQNKRMKAHKDLIAGLEVGDEIAINGGILGRVTKLTDDFITLSIADNVEIKCQRQAVTTVLPKGTLKGV